jgi:hypothetical protein
LPDYALHQRRRQNHALLPCPGGLDRGIQRQDIGLEGNAVNHADDVADFLRAGRNLLHGAGNPGRLLATFMRCVCRMAIPDAWRALSAFWPTVAVSCSMLAAVCASAAACCSVREDKSLCPSRFLKYRYMAELP